jgi:hypothetical protein
MMGSTAHCAPQEQENTMKKIASLALLTLLSVIATAGSATVHIECKAKNGNCVAPVPPVPPAPPAPPTPPAPPAMPPGADDNSAAMHALPALPTLPALPALPLIPAPPPPPPLPEVPAGAHAACAGKPDGSQLTYTMAKGETMRGVCERDDGKMVFRLRMYHKD